MPKRKSLALAGAGNQGSKRTTMAKKSCAAGQTPVDVNSIEQLGRERDKARLQASESVASESISTDGVADRLISWSKESRNAYVHSSAFFVIHVSLGAKYIGCKHVALIAALNSSSITL